MAERGSLSWERDSKSGKYENGEADGLMWATVPCKAYRHHLKCFLLPVGCCYKGGHEETKPTNSAKVVTVVAVLPETLK